MSVDGLGIEEFTEIFSREKVKLFRGNLLWKLGDDVSEFIGRGDIDVIDVNFSLYEINSNRRGKPKFHYTSIVKYSMRSK